MDDRTESKLDRLFEKLSDLAVDVARIATSVESNTDDIAEHIKRTNLLEEKLEKTEEKWHTQLDEALIPIKWGKVTLKLATATGVILGVWQLIQSLRS